MTALPPTAVTSLPRSYRRARVLEALEGCRTGRARETCRRYLAQVVAGDPDPLIRQLAETSPAVRERAARALRPDGYSNEEIVG